MRILLIIFIFFYTSFAKENNEIDILVAISVKLQINMILWGHIINI